MIGPGYEELAVLNRKLDELLNRYNELRNELVNIKDENEALKKRLIEKDDYLTDLEKKYEKNRFSGALMGEGENAMEAKRKINELVREIDNCVALINK
jgi:predicted  nucleic acid-binding Zn-ribbon protein